MTGRSSLIGDETELPYHKPPLSKTFIKDADAKPQLAARRGLLHRQRHRSTGRATGSKPSIPAAAALEIAGGGSARLRPADPRHRLAAAHSADRRARTLPACCRCARSPMPAPIRELSRAKSRTSSSSAAASSGWRSRRRWRLAAAGDRGRGAGPAAWPRGRAGRSRPCRASGWQRRACAPDGTTIDRLEGENGHVVGRGRPPPASESRPRW